MCDTPAVKTLIDGKIDLAITLSPMNVAGVEFVPCFNDELRMVVPPSHFGQRLER